jgi:hypothetical protein
LSWNIAWAADHPRPEGQHGPAHLDPDHVSGLATPRHPARMTWTPRDVLTELTFVGIGWHTTADALLANTAAAMAREKRLAARLALADAM